MGARCSGLTARLAGTLGGLALLAGPPAAAAGWGGPVPALTPPQAVMATVTRIQRGLTSTRYQHRLRVDEPSGTYQWDCSIMTTWIVQQAAPWARPALAPARPLARDFFYTITQARTDQPEGGWLRLPRVVDLGPGDLFAWLKPGAFRERRNTGHVGVVINQPRAHPRFPSVWLVRVADATRELHGQDSRPPGGDGGFGTGTIAFLVNDDGAPLAYGWYGQDQDPATFVPTKIAFARLVKPPRR